MPNTSDPTARGSQKWIQELANGRPDLLNVAIHEQLPTLRVSPILDSVGEVQKASKPSQIRRDLSRF